MPTTIPARAAGVTCRLGIAALLGLLSLPSVAQANPSDAYGKPVKRLVFDGLKRTKEYIVTRELLTKVGEPLLEGNLVEDKQRLNLLDIFSSITITPELEGDSVVVRYEFVETFPILPMPALSITDENGVSIGAGVKTPNFRGKDIYISTSVLVGGATTIALWIENPWFAGNRLGYRFEYYYRDRDNKIGDFREKANELYLRIGGRLTEHIDFGGSVAFVNINSDVDSVTLSPENSDKVSRLGSYIGYDTRDAPTDTRHGWWNELALTWEMEIFENSSNFGQVDLDLRRYFPLGSRGALALFSLTTLRTGKVGEQVAVWQQFGVGGTNTVRGHDYAVQIGKQQFINTVEYRYTLVAPHLLRLPFGINYRGGLSVALYADAGLAWSESNQFATDNFITGGGVGVRILLPVVSMLRFDLGWGQTGRGVFLHVGGFEKPVMARQRVR